LSARVDPNLDPGAGLLGAALQRRIAALERRLSEEGIGTALPPRPRPRPALPVLQAGAAATDSSGSSNGGGGSSSSSSKNNDNPTAISAIHGNEQQEQILPTFLATLRSMAANVARTPRGGVQTTKHRALSALLSVAELSLAETSRLADQLAAREAERRAAWEDREAAYRQVVAGLVARVEGADAAAGDGGGGGQREREETMLAEARRRVTELTDELDACRDRLREVTAELNTSLEQQQQQQQQQRQQQQTTAAAVGKDAATGMDQDDDGGDGGEEASHNPERIVQDEEEEGGGGGEERDDGTTAQAQFWRENERGVEAEGTSYCSVGSGHEAIHVELRAQAALLEEENRRLLQRLDVNVMGAAGTAGGGGGPPSASATCTASCCPVTAILPSPPVASQYPPVGIAPTPQHHHDVLQLQSQNEDLQRALRDRDERLARAEASLRSLLEQSQTGAAEAARWAAEGDVARRRLAEESRRVEAAERTVREAERERSDVLRAYRAVVEERARLAARVEEVAAERSRLGQQLGVREEELRSMQHRVGEMEQELNHRLQQRAECELRLAEVTREGQCLRQSLAAAEAQNNGLRQEVEASRQSTGMASNQAMELHRAVTKARQETGEVRRSLSALEVAKSKLEAALAEERRRCEGMEDVVSATRTKEAAALEQIQKLCRENAQLATKLNEADARLEAASARSSSRKGRLSTRGEALALGNRPSREKEDANSGVPATILLGN